MPYGTGSYGTRPYGGRSFPRRIFKVIGRVRIFILDTARRIFPIN